MSSTQLRSLEIAPETSFCGLSASATTPNDTGLSYTAVDFLDLTQLLVEGEALVDDPSGLRGGLYSNPVRPVDIGGDTPVRGSFSFDFYLRGWGSSDAGIIDLLKTRFDLSASASASSTIATATSGTQAVTCSTAVNTASGGVVCAEHDGLRIYGYVCAYTSGTSQVVTPNLVARGADVGDDYDGCWTLKLPTQGLPATTSSVAIKITGQGWTQKCYGCTLTSLSLAGGGDSRAVRCTATVDCAYVETTTSGTPQVLASDSTLGVLHQLASPLGLGEDFSLSTATFAAGTDADSLSVLPSQCVDEWTCNIEFTTAFASCGSYIVGRSRAETVQANVTLQLSLGSLAAYSVLKTQWQSQHARTVLLGFAGDNIGGAIAIPAAVVSEFTPAPDLGSDFARTSVTLAPGPCPALTQPCFVLALRD